MKNMIVYTIVINNKTVYVGRTNDIDRREKEHRTSYLKYLKTNDLSNGKKLYMWLYQNEIKPSEIVLNPVYIAKNKLESKQYEAFLILWFKFTQKNYYLQQKTPSITDR